MSNVKKTISLSDSDINHIKNGGRIGVVKKTGVLQYFPKNCNIKNYYMYHLIDKMSIKFTTTLTFSIT